MRTLWPRYWPLAAALLVLLALVAAFAYRPLLRLATGARLVDVAELQGGDADPVFIDLRAPEVFAAGHIAGAVRVGLADLNGFLARHPFARDRLLVLVCYRGRLASLAAPAAAMHGYTRARVLEGGPERWRALGLAMETGPGETLPLGDGAAPGAAPRLALSPVQQLVAFVSGGVIKPIYMVLTFVLMRRLWGASGTALRLLLHGLTWFFVGEVFCVLNFGLHGSGLFYSLDFAHGAGMVVMSALVPWGLYRMFDDKVLAFADPERRCMMQRVCGHCWKQEAVVCPAQRVLLLGAVCCLALALMPWTSPLRPAQVVTLVNGYDTEYGVPVLNHLVELRLYPLAALLFFAATLAVLLRGTPASVRRAEVVFFIGFGFLFYPLLRHLLVNTYPAAPQWADFWEETTELMMVAGVGWVLFVLRKPLGLVAKA